MIQEYEWWYRIQRYEWAKKLGLLDKYFPVVGKLEKFHKEISK